MIDYSKVDPNFDRFIMHAKDVAVTHPNVSKEARQKQVETLARLEKEDKEKSK